MLRAALAADGALNRETLESWRRGMSEAGYSPGTVNAALSVVNGYLAFIGRKELQMERNADVAEPAAPELRREEYIRPAAGGKAAAARAGLYAHKGVRHHPGSL